MFLFIAGVQPRTIRLDKYSHACPRCGFHELSPKRVDHYFSLFFIPLFRVKRGVSFVSCDHCHSVFDDSGRLIEEPRVFRSSPWKCPDCGRSLGADFDFCPRCGKKVSRS
jgi:predicted RNA-binding Zn-ribbon protein involved in translation (DUF1610 family)